MMKLRHGFTLIETMIVLVISALLLSLSLLLTHHLALSHFQNVLFWQKFQNQFELSETFARRYHSNIIVEFYPHGSVIFHPDNSKLKLKSLKPPKNLKIMNSNIIYIRKDGHIDPTTVSWKLNGHTKIDQKFQLGWGLYTLDYKNA